MEKVELLTGCYGILKARRGDVYVTIYESDGFTVHYHNPVNDFRVVQGFNSLGDAVREFNRIFS